jgi:hypothetical protein
VKKPQVRVRKLTVAEVQALQADVVRRMAGLKRAYEASMGIERDRQLLGALILCGTFRPLPVWVYQALFDQQKAALYEHDQWLMTGQHVPRVGLQKPDRQWLRWLVAEEELAARRGERKRLPNGMKEPAFKAASQRLKGTLAKGAPSTIRHDHVKVAGLIRRANKA